uniref:transmembrane protein 244 n=1 Tax=Nyctereutes procyonoides TaxID=34880 RepID=UPI0024449981|nr:transmembrane protein 244 [Nyctereutes procyonoides]
MDFRTEPILVQMRTTPAFPVRKTFTVDFEVLPAPWVSKQNKVVLQNLLICVILFHTVYYEVLGMCCMIFRAYELDVLAPFDFKTNPLWLNTNLKVIVLLVSTQVTYFVCGLLFVLVVEERVWDYAISVTILHAVITSAKQIMLEFPLTSHWWAALAKKLPGLRDALPPELPLTPRGDVSGHSDASEKGMVRAGSPGAGSWRTCLNSLGPPGLQGSQHGGRAARPGDAIWGLV